MNGLSFTNVDKAITTQKTIVRKTNGLLTILNLYTTNEAELIRTTAPVRKRPSRATSRILVIKQLNRKIIQNNKAPGFIVIALAERLFCFCGFDLARLNIVPQNHDTHAMGILRYFSRDYSD